MVFTYAMYSNVKGANGHRLDMTQKANDMQICLLTCSATFVSQL
jgi:hypothetical protein